MARQNLNMAREIDIGDVVAITATVRKRIGECGALNITGNHFPYSILDPKAKPGDKIRLEGERPSPWPRRLADKVRIKEITPKKMRR
ncbi:hypothetical protein FKO01_51980 [Mesorhizobium sp. B2-3-3]|nr:hypothetical protein FKO01_51980 [Mesorhizobium sp. B2-3-3]